MKDVIESALSKYIANYKIAIGRRPSPRFLSQARKNLSEISEGNAQHIRFKHTRGGKLSYFYYYKKVFFPPLGKEIYVFPFLFCSARASAQKEFQLQFAKDIKKLESTAMIQVFESDFMSQRYFERYAMKTIHLTLGRVRTGLKHLSIRKTPRIKILRMKKSDIERAVRIELRAHQGNVSSTMHEVFTKKGATAMCRKFLGGLVRQKRAFSVLVGRAVVGHFGFFDDPKSRTAFIATVAIHPSHQGRGIGLALYQGMLTEMQNRGITIYEGFTSTDSVLAMLGKLERKTFMRGYFVDSNDWT